MNRVSRTTLALVAAVLLTSVLPSLLLAADPPADRVVVMYFHRTERCPTCLKMGSYTEEAVKSGFAEQLKSGKVESHFIDFQDAKNAELTQGYGVAGPTLIVARVAGNKVTEYQNLQEIWTKARDRASFVEYVQSNIKGYLK
jgi:thiol-disulfide isomerase/thioredoxin